MGSKPTVAFRVEADTKAAWSEAVEQSDEYANLSHLIKKSVNRELHSERPTSSEAGQDTEQIGELADTVERLQGQVSDLEDAITDATRSMNADGGVSEETTTKVFSALPRGPERATDAEGIAEGLDIDADTARLALESIADTAAVERLDMEQVLDEGGTKVVEWEGNTIEIDTGAPVVKRNNPLWFRKG